MATVTAKADRRQTKKSLKQDKLVDVAYKAEHFYLTHKNQVLGVVGAIVVAILIIVVVRQMSATSHREETYQISLGKMAYGSGNLSSAKSDFESVTTKYSGETAAEAHYYLGRIATEEGDIATAEDHFKKCIDQTSDENLVAASMSGLAASLENRKQYAEAAAKYEALASKYSDVAFAPEALSQAARLYLKLNQKDDYKRLLKKIVDDYPKSSNFAKAKRDLEAVS